MSLRLLVSLTHVVALEADYWLTGRSDEIEGKEKHRSTSERVTYIHTYIHTLFVT